MVGGSWMTVSAWWWRSMRPARPKGTPRGATGPRADLDLDERAQPGLARVADAARADARALALGGRLGIASSAARSALDPSGASPGHRDSDWQAGDPGGCVS